MPSALSYIPPDLLKILCDVAVCVCMCMRARGCVWGGGGQNVFLVRGVFVYKGGKAIL
jgi:hypothetical protein